MTAEDKAKELVEKYMEHFYGFGIEPDTRKKEAKECAIICCDEILNNDSDEIGISSDNALVIMSRKYWQEVKQHIIHS